jgi:hypothetical protein
LPNFFGTAYLRPNIEAARARMVNLVSLHLEDSSGGDLEKAARSLRDHTFLSLSRGGSEMLKRLWAMPEDASYALLLRQSQKEFLAEWSLRSLAEYRQDSCERRQGHQTGDFGGAVVCRKARRGLPPDFDRGRRIDHPYRNSRLSERGDAGEHYPTPPA